ncbi:NUDIX hydrolase [Geminicoccus flavidas]|uniref:NUDIX hydrolase n=1 Tax=Geminicoccus flavidas TaxID=2506407 RepID=UPI001F245FFF|nr:NUDIX hydrolase [Geminicoccus flavidas]
MSKKGHAAQEGAQPAGLPNPAPLRPAEQAAGKQPAVEQPVAKKPSAGKATVKKAVAKEPTPKKPASKKLALKKKAQPAPRLQYGVLALRVRGSSADVLLITSRGTRRWIIPKGNPEKGRTGAEVGAIEAFEEAGLIGEVWTKPLGTYLSPKHLPSGRVVTCEIEVYRMDVEEVLDDWPEKGQRERRWYSLDEAAMLVGEGGLVALMLKVNAELIGR